MKSLMSLWRELANEAASWCCTSADRDIKTVAVRVKSEGESFFTISLPQFAKGFEQALDSGSVDPSLFSGFHCRGGFPEFLRGFLGQIFDSDGSLLDVPSMDCIRAVRQLTLVYGKIERQCSDARISRAMRRYVEIEEELEEIDTSSFEEFLPHFRKASTLLWADVFSHVENSVLGTHQLARDWHVSGSLGASQERTGMFAARERQAADAFLHLLPESFRLGGSDRQVGDCEIVDPSSRFLLVPRNGPGATADRIRGNAKFSISEWPSRLDSEFPYGDYALPSWRSYYQLDRVKFLEPGQERPVKVVPVPKTLKTPRIIAEEPASMQYCQQALAHQFVDALEHRLPIPPSGGRELCDLGRWLIGFKEQEPNRLLALSGSINGCLATLDLSEASDRVLNRHVVELLSGFPQLSAAVQATRSTKADVPGHGVIPLAKFASMGSALCFPIEAMVFTTIIVAAVSYERGELPTRQLIKQLIGQVRVYGDDIIVPVEYVPRVVQFLHSFGLVVNMDKSFWNGKFRESCGGDYYDGEWVTPIRCRQDLPRSLSDVKQVVSLVSLRNQLYSAGYWRTVAKLDERISSLFRGSFPIVEPTAAVLGRQSVSFPHGIDWADPNLHVPLVRGYKQRSVTPESPITGEGALLKFLFKRGFLPSQDPDHLERQGRPEAVSIKPGWHRPY
jgi:hypothetical protein